MNPILEKITHFIPDRLYLYLKFRHRLGFWPNLKNPQRYNEKLQWLKLYDRKPIYTVMVDKVKARDYVASKIGAQYLIPSLGVWSDPEEIDFDALPNQFVLKCNHNSGTGMCICKDKSQIDISKVKAGLKRGLAEDYFYHGREWPYKDVPRRIIGEKFMIDEAEDDLKDYKFFCFDGVVKALFIVADRNKKNKRIKLDWFDANGNHLDMERGYPKAEVPPALPQNFEKMKELASILSEGIPQLRVDFYEVNGQIYFGELTFSPGNGLEPFYPDEWDYKFGEWIVLPDQKKN